MQKASMMETDWTRLYIVRHGETQWNAEGRWQGWLDSSLTPKGQQQARHAAALLKDVHPQALYCSDAGRARQTAAIIGEAVGLTPIPEAALRERFYGDYEGLTSNEIDERFPGTRYEAGRDRRDTWRPIAGETLVEVSARVIAGLRLLAEQHPGETIIAVTHAGVLRVLDALVTHQSLDDIWDRVPGNCAIFVLEINPGGDLRLVQHFAEL